VITYLDSDVDKVEKLVRKEFEIDEKNSIDKRILQSNEFGYRSLHIVASIDSSRLKLTEYQRYKGLKFEIQIRSILQHAWAEIEHDLGYKGKSSIPESHVRSFNRLSALLESADIEFDRLKKELAEYEKDVTKLIVTTPDTVPINQASIDSLVKSNKTFQMARDYVIKDCDAVFDQPNDYSGIMDKFELFNITNIGELQRLISNNSDEYIRFIKDFIKKGISKNLAYNLPLYWFQHFLAAKTLNAEFIEKYLKYRGRNIDAKPHEFIERYNRIKKYN